MNPISIKPAFTGHISKKHKRNPVKTAMLVTAMATAPLALSSCVTVPQSGIALTAFKEMNLEGYKFRQFFNSEKGLNSLSVVTPDDKLVVFHTDMKSNGSEKYKLEKSGNDIMLKWGENEIIFENNPKSMKSDDIERTIKVGNIELEPLEDDNNDPIHIIMNDNGILVDGKVKVIKGNDELEMDGQAIFENDNEVKQ